MYMHFCGLNVNMTCFMVWIIIYYAIKFFQITKYFKYTENSN